jgi:hypothetical protein
VRRGCCSSFSTTVLNGRGHACTPACGVGDLVGAAGCTLTFCTLDPWLPSQGGRPVLLPVEPEDAVADAASHHVQHLLQLIHAVRSSYVLGRRICIPVSSRRAGSGLRSHVHVRIASLAVVVTGALETSACQYMINMQSFHGCGTCSLLSALCSLLSALCSLLSALCSLLSALCSLLSALCSLLSALCSLLSAVCLLSAVLLLFCCCSAAVLLLFCCCSAAVCCPCASILALMVSQSVVPVFAFHSSEPRQAESHTTFPRHRLWLCKH